MKLETGQCEHPNCPRSSATTGIMAIGSSESRRREDDEYISRLCNLRNVTLGLQSSKNSTCFLKQMDTLPEVRRRVTDMKCSPAGSLFDGLWTPPAAHSLLIPHLSPWSSSCSWNLEN